MSFEIVNPATLKVYKTIPYQKDALEILKRAKESETSWKQTGLESRIEIMKKFIDIVASQATEIADELCSMIGRPVSQNHNEVRGFQQRADHLIATAQQSLEPIIIEDSDKFIRKIEREPLGTVFIISAWNYPYLTTVNGLVPALLAGNCVLLKHAPQTFPVGERLAKNFLAAGGPLGVFSNLNIDHLEAEKILSMDNLDVGINGVLFTGSVGGGEAVAAAASKGMKFIPVGLELGGNDAAYVRSDVDIPNVVENLLDGAFYNSGQSCCGIERIYIHSTVYEAFLKECEKQIKGYKLGDGTVTGVNLGPVVNINAADRIRKQVADALQCGALGLIDPSLFPAAKSGTCYVAPQILINVNHSMKIMKEEIFGPVVGIMPVESDEQAISLMNDSQYGLTGSIWTKDWKKGLELGHKLEVGTSFVNRCDYLDPALGWVGVKRSGRGVTLSKFGFDSVTRPKSFHIRK